MSLSAKLLFVLIVIALLLSNNASSKIYLLSQGKGEDELQYPKKRPLSPLTPQCGLFPRMRWVWCCLAFVAASLAVFEVKVCSKVCLYTSSPRLAALLSRCPLATRLMRPIFPLFNGNLQILWLAIYPLLYGRTGPLAKLEFRRERLLRSNEAEDVDCYIVLDWLEPMTLRAMVSRSDLTAATTNGKPFILRSIVSSFVKVFITVAVGVIRYGSKLGKPTLTKTSPYADNENEDNENEDNENENEDNENEDNEQMSTEIQFENFNSRTLFLNLSKEATFSKTNKTFHYSASQGKRKVAATDRRNRAAWQYPNFVNLTPRNRPKYSCKLKNNRLQQQSPSRRQNKIRIANQLRNGSLDDGSVSVSVRRYRRIASSKSVSRSEDRQSIFSLTSISATQTLAQPAYDTHLFPKARLSSDCLFGNAGTAAGSRLRNVGGESFLLRINNDSDKRENDWDRRNGDKEGKVVFHESPPAVSHAAPAVSHAAPAVSHAAPAVSHAAPAVSHVAPAVSRELTDCWGCCGIVVIVPRVTSTSSDFVVRACALSALNAGFAVVVLNHQKTLRALDRVGYTLDLRITVESLHRRFPTLPITCIGLSMGANIVVKYLGEAASESCANQNEMRRREQSPSSASSVWSPIAAAVSISNPVDLCIVAAKMRNLGWGRFFVRYLEWFLCSVIRISHRMFDSGLEMEEDGTREGSVIREFDEVFSTYTEEHSKVDGSCSAKRASLQGNSCSQSLSEVQTPLLMINATDDPLCPWEAMDLFLPSRNPHIVIALTRSGSHCAFFTGHIAKPRFWALDLATEFLRAAVHPDVLQPPLFPPTQKTRKQS